MKARLVSITVTLAAAGCATSPSHRDLAAFLKAHEHTVAATEMRVGASDIIKIDAPLVHEINDETPEVQPDGKISLRLVGEVKVAGLTPREISTKLKELLAPYYQQPDVQVRILRQPNRVFYVIGEVDIPGPHLFTGRDTVMHALVAARPNNIAWQSQVKVIRPSPTEDDRHVLKVNVDSMVKEGDTRLNVLLEPGDVVYVPPTPLGWLGKKVRELLFPAQPVLEAYRTPSDFAYAQDEYENPDRFRSVRRR